MLRPTLWMIPSGPASPPPAASLVRWTHWAATPIDSTSDAMPSSEPFIGRRLPMRMISQKAIAGITGISQACSRNHPVGRSAAITRSTLHLGELVEGDGAAVAVDEDDHPQ